MSEILNLHEGNFALDHIKVPFTVRQTTYQEIDIQIGDGFCRVMIFLRNDGNFEVITRDYKAIKNNTENVQGAFLGNIRKDW